MHMTPMEFAIDELKVRQKRDERAWAVAIAMIENKQFHPGVHLPILTARDIYAFVDAMDGASSAPLPEPDNK